MLQDGPPELGTAIGLFALIGCTAYQHDSRKGICLSEFSANNVRNYHADLLQQEKTNKRLDSGIYGHNAFLCRD